MREKDISRLLTDEYAERILVATQENPRSVQEISDKYDIPIAACYRKIHQLRSAVLMYQDGIFKVKFDFDNDRDLSGKWIELNSSNGS
ncbi:MAG: hypothetical protein DMD31_17740 [Gemmatimonadetes bacterium]|nr:MAG: hypothetical protein DMD31_17740 [Gemmatimonadota bacterium]